MSSIPQAICIYTLERGKLLKSCYRYKLLSGPRIIDTIYAQKTGLPGEGPPPEKLRITIEEYRG